MHILFSFSRELKMVGFVMYVVNMGKGTDFGILRGSSKRNTQNEFLNGTKNPLSTNKTSGN